MVRSDYECFTGILLFMFNVNIALLKALLVAGVITSISISFGLLHKRNMFARGSKLFEQLLSCLYCIFSHIRIDSLHGCKEPRWNICTDALNSSSCATSDES